MSDPKKPCLRPPSGWRCTRGEHEDGPCAALPDTEPKTREEYEHRAASHMAISGFGMDVTQHFPCPACSARDWMVIRILDLDTKGAEPTRCRECGRTLRIEFNRSSFSTSFRVLLVEGPDVSPWVPVTREKTA